MHYSRQEQYLKIAVFCVIIAIFLAACNTKEPTEPNPPKEKEEMFPFLKIGNSWTYETGLSPIRFNTFIIDSIEIISDNESKYLGTSKEYSPWDSDTNTEKNIELFYLKDSLLTVILKYVGCKINYNWKEGEVIDSLLGTNQDDEAEWFPITVQRGNYSNQTLWGYEDYGEDFIYSDCIMFECSWFKDYPNHPNGGNGASIKTILSNKYGLIHYRRWGTDAGGSSGTSYYLLHRNF